MQRAEKGVEAFGLKSIYCQSPRPWEIPGSSHMLVRDRGQLELQTEVVEMNPFGVE